MQWFRMYAEAIDDEKLRLLAFEDRWHFVALLCLKSTGLLDEPDSAIKKQKICVKLGLDSLELETVMKRLETVGLVSSSGQPVNWNKRQFLSDSSTSRVRAFRERNRNVTVTPSDTESDTDTESEKNKNQDRSARAARSARATRLPINFALTPERRAIAEAEKADPDREFENFTDHWRAASGQKARKNDWDATWRIWCRRAPDFKPRPRFPSDTRGGPSPAQLEAEGLRKLMTRRESIGLARFRDPSPGETSAQYRQAQDAEYNRLQQERERRKAVAAVAQLAAKAGQ